MGMPSYLPGIFVILAGIAMLVGRKPLSLLQYSALLQARIAGTDREKTLSWLRQVILVGSVLFIVFGLYLVLNPLSS
jgi:hypothetical protein